MWEAFCAFHICIAYFLPELLWRSVVERAVWAVTVVLLPRARHAAPYIIKAAEPVRVEALVAQSSVEALDMSILHRPAGLDMHQADLPVLSPAHDVRRGELRAVF